MERRFTYFVSDVHLGLNVFDPAERERRFVSFLKSVPTESTQTIYLLGDIWDFWYEYKHVVPKGYVRVFAALGELIDAGVRICFVPGNHDIWAYSYFAELGIEVLEQPIFTKIGSKTFCLGHGDGLGPGMRTYKLMRWAFHNPFLQWCFSLLHPYIAFSLGYSWSSHSRLTHVETDPESGELRHKEYAFKGSEEPLFKYCEALGADRHFDFFIFGHYHCRVDMALPDSSRLLVMRDWTNDSEWLRYDCVEERLEFNA